MMLLTKEQIQCNLCSGDLLDDAFMKVAKAQAKKMVEAINDELVESDSRNMWYLNKRFWQSLLEEVSEATESMREGIKDL